MAPSTRRMWASMSPTAVFLVVNWLSGVAPAAIAATMTAIAVIAWRARHRDHIGWIMPITLTYVVARGTVSALTSSEDVYFGIGIAASAVVATGVLGSAWTSRPVGLWAIPLVVRYEEHVRAHARYLTVARHVTAMWGVAELGVTAWEAWHLRQVGPVGFIGRRTLIGWPVMAFVVFWLIFYTRFRLDPLAHRLQQLTADDSKR
jgi:hypothetical protein